MNYKAEIMNADAVKRAIIRISHEILEKTSGAENVCLIGIKTRGTPLAVRIAQNIERFENITVDVGEIDITLYRDDVDAGRDDAMVKGSQIDFDVTGKTVVLVDDVIYTGRTVHAAMDAVISIGRPAAIRLAALIDRGHREFPIRPDFVGKNVPTAKHEVVKVNLLETDEKDCVELYQMN